MKKSLVLAALASCLVVACAKDNGGGNKNPNGVTPMSNDAQNGVCSQAYRLNYARIVRETKVMNRFLNMGRRMQAAQQAREVRNACNQLLSTSGPGSCWWEIDGQTGETVSYQALAPHCERAGRLLSNVPNRGSDRDWDHDRDNDRRNGPGPLPGQR